MFWFSVLILIIAAHGLLGVIFNWEFGKKHWQKGKSHQTHDYIIAFYIFKIALGLFIYAAIFD